MNIIDRSFAELASEIGSLGEKELYYRIRRAFDAVPAETRRSCQDFFNRFGFWGRLDPDNGIFEQIELKELALFEHLSEYVWLYERLEDYRSKKTLYSILSHGTLSISNNTPFGQMTGASANGRHAWMPLSDGISPSQGADFKGPTAIIKSVSKMSNDSMNIGMVHNFKIMAGLLDTPEGEESLITLLRTACMFGNGEMQFNYLDNETLIEAQKHPEQYRDLIVRVAGYSAFFVELCKDVQDEIISRTMLNHF